MTEGLATILVAVGSVCVSGTVAFFALKGRTEADHVKREQERIAHDQVHQLLAGHCEERHGQLNKQVAELFELQRGTHEVVIQIAERLKVRR